MRPKLLPALLAVATIPQSASCSEQPPIRLSAESARENAFLIFNSVHSAMRQWGSSLHHNGMALIPATVPRGTLFYHGSPSKSTPVAPEWLAFEMEHAENFARSRPYRFRPQPPPSSSPSTQKPLSNPPPENATIRGYLHTFRTARPLSLLYIDGTSAGKTSFGTVDTQDFVLRLHDPDDGTDPWGDHLRAADLCQIVTSPSWGYDGVIRMEIGFEVIFCGDFGGGSNGGGLETVRVVRSPGLEGRERWEGQGGKGMAWRWARGVGERYDGIGGRRVELDFSRMVSALWYPVNVTNPDEKKRMEGFPRLVGATQEERKVIRGRVEELAGVRGGREGIDWQGVVDMVVTRYEKRLGYMASEGINPVRFVREVFAATISHVEYPPAPGDVTFAKADGEQEREARRQCAAQYLLPVEWRRGSWTKEDKMLYVAISRVTERICDALFDARMALEKARPDLALAVMKGDDDIADGKRMQGAVQLGQAAMRELTDELRWTTWKKCRGCNIDEICFVAMWPLGRVSDHYSPGCVKEEVFETTEFWQDNYWDSLVGWDGRNVITAEA